MTQSYHSELDPRRFLRKVLVNWRNINYTNDGIKTKRPRLIRVIGTPVEQPSPEVCSQPAYVLTCAVGMAPTGYAAHVRHRSGECQGSRHKQACTLRTRSMRVIGILRQLTSRIGVRFHINTHRAQEFAQEGHDFRWINLKRT